jgi:CRISPR/Cas system-associated protein endoribonuclease Cas2
MEKENKIVIYQNSSGAIELRGDVKNETIWATQAQIADLFGVERSVVTKHIINIYKDKELEEKRTCAKFAQVQREGKREVVRDIEHYNLDTIISVGYRVNSKTATQFRQWATKTLREHITKGYTINRKQITKNYDSFMKAVASIENLLPEHINLDPKAVIELIKEFASTWVSLDSYDRESLQIKGVTKKNVKLTGDELTSAISNLKDELIKKGETTDLFATEKQRDSVQGIVGNVMQTFGGKPLYETIEEKSANLLYFMVKNHPFIDGNKRSGAFAFIWFLRKTKAKGFKNINPATLTALTLFIAESHPKNKEQMIALITQLLM